MPRNGSGVYTLPAGSAISNGDTSDASDVNDPLNDLEADANAVRPIVAGGTGASSAAAALANLGLTVTAAEINALDGLTATVTELNYSDGVTSNIQTQLDGKQPLDSDLTALAGLGGSDLGFLDRTAVGTFTTRAFASQAEAEAGTGEIQVMNPLRVAQAIAALTVPTDRVLLATKTAAVSASLDFTEFDNATYRRYEFELEFVLPATDSVSLWVRTSTDGGANYDAGASDYAWGQTGTSAGAATTGASNAAAQIVLNTAVPIGNAAGEYGVSGLLSFDGAPLATMPTVMNGRITYFSNGGGFVQLAIGGTRWAAADVDALQFLSSIGNLTSGTIRMYGVI